jgi:hypothetical protein
MLVIQDKDNFLLDISADFLERTWAYFIPSDINVNLINYIKQQTTELHKLNARFQNLKNLQEPVVVQEFEFLL